MGEDAVREKRLIVDNSNPYLVLAESDISGKLATPETIKNPYLEIVEKDQTDQRIRFDQVIHDAIKANPDLAGESQRLSQGTGVSPSFVETNIEQFRRSNRQKQIQDRVSETSNPMLMRQMSDPEFAKISTDQVESLSKLSELMQYVEKVPGDIVAQWKSGKRQIERGKVATSIFSGNDNPELPRRLADIDVELEQLKRGSKTVLGETAKVVSQLSTMLPDALALGGMTGMTTGAAGIAAGPGAPVTVPTLALAGLTAGFTASMATQTYEIEAGNAYADMLKNGIDKNTARNVGIGVGLVNAAFEMTGMALVAAPFKKALAMAVTETLSERLIKPTVSRGLIEFGKGYGLGVGGEVTTEFLQEVTNIMGEELARRISRPDLESKFATPKGRAELADQLADVFEATVKGMVLLGGVGPGVRLRGDYKRATEAEKQAEFFTDLTDLSKNSAVRDRNQDSFENFIASQVNDKTATIFLEGEQTLNVLNQVGVSLDELRKVSPEMADQLADAVKTGGDITIPTAQYAARIAGTDLGNALLPHMRLSEDAFSAVELQQFQSYKLVLAKEAKALMDSQTETNETFTKEAKIIENIVFDEIKASKTYTDTVSRNYAEFFRDFVVTQAAASKISPAAFYEKYKYKVRSASDGAGISSTGTLTQPAFEEANYRPEVSAWAKAQFGDRTAPNGSAVWQNFTQWFGDSKVVDADGKPLVVYHGTDRVFEHFDTRELGRFTGAKSAKKGFFFTSSSQNAGIYAG